LLVQSLRSTHCERIDPPLRGRTLRQSDYALERRAAVGAIRHHQPEPRQSDTCPGCLRGTAVYLPGVSGPGRRIHCEPGADELPRWRRASDLVDREDAISGVTAKPFPYVT